MNYYLTVFIVLLASLAYGQSLLENEIKIDVHIEGLQDGKMFFLNSVSEARLDSSVVKNDKLTFSYKGEPASVVIFSRPDMGGNSTDQCLAMFITDKYDMKLTGHVDSVENLSIEGSDNHDELYRFHFNIKMPLEMALDTILPFPQNTSVRDSLQNIINIAHTNFIKEHSDSYPGLFVLYYQILDKLYTKDGALELLSLFEKNYSGSIYYKSCKSMIANKNCVQVGSIAPDFSCTDSNNKMISLSDYRGKYVLLEFWSSWCGPCRSEVPFLVKAYEKYKKLGLEIIGISLDINKATWRKTIEEKKFSWIQICDFKGHFNEIAVLYTVNSVPNNFLINPEGRIIAKNLRTIQLKEKLEEIMKQ